MLSAGAGEKSKNEDVLQLANVENVGAVPSATPTDHELEKQGGKPECEAPAAESLPAIKHATEPYESATEAVLHSFKNKPWKLVQPCMRPPSIKTKFRP